MRSMSIRWPVALVLCAASSGATAAGRPLGDLSGPWQLFVDDHLVAEKVGVTRVYHPFEKHAGNPVLVADKPWEGKTAYLYGTVLPAEAGKGYRMWYHSWADGAYRHLYATSADGLRWEKPDLGRVDYKGPTKNNILIRRTHEDHSPQVIHTPWETDPQRRYKLITYEYGRTPPKYTVSGYYGACSPDGVRWTDVPRNPVLLDPGDVGNFVWDPHTGRYIGYPKKFTDVRGFRRRCVSFSETTTFETWPESKMVLIPDEFDDRWVRRPGQHTDFYGLSAFAYESMYLGFLWVFPITDGKDDGPIFVELVSSRDGVNWARQERPRDPILPLGPKGAWDCGMIFTPNHPLVEGDRIRLYYGGFNVTHGADGAAAIGLATLRKDGFASLDAGEAVGTITTWPLLGLTAPLYVNCRADGGSVRVELLDAAGGVVPGFDREACDPLTKDGVRQEVTWKGSSRLPESMQPLRLRFVLQKASLYSFAAGDALRVVRADAVNPRVFEASDAATRSALEIPDTASPGTHFTLAANVKTAARGFMRLFSSYRGSGPPLTTELIFDIDPSGKTISGLRGVINGGEVMSDKLDFAADRPHHCALTYADGDVRLYFDGAEVASGVVPAGPVLLGTHLRFGEDVGGPANEQFVGRAEDIVLIRRALSADEVKALAAKGARAFAAEAAPAPQALKPVRAMMAPPETPARAADIGSRLELFADRYLIDRLEGAELRLHHPQPGEVVLRLDRPWEGIVSGYFTVIKDGDRYLMYYRGRPTSSRADGSAGAHEVACLAHSRDGITWERPNLGLLEVNGTRENNVILTEPKTVTHNFCPFLDTRPGVPAFERFKAIGGTGADGLYGYVSGDGIHWRPIRDKALITRGAFDSQNVAFWSPAEGLYLCYFRTFKNGVRWIARSTSQDFLHWTAPVDMTFGDAPPEHLYTNQTHPYFRAPHIYIATAARFNPGRRALTDEQVRLLDLDNPRNYAGLKLEDSDAVFMTSRGGNRYDRTFLESFIRPGLDLRNWVARANYPALGVVPTGPAEMSIYVQRHYGQPTNHIQRMTLRTDGFVSVGAPYAGGEMTTRPLVFAGKELVINFSSSAVGGVRVEIQDDAGSPVAGFALADALEMIGDEIERVVAWKGGTDVSRLAGRAVRLRFVMKDADLYSMRFR